MPAVAAKTTGQPGRVWLVVLTSLTTVFLVWCLDALFEFLPHRSQGIDIYGNKTLLHRVGAFAAAKSSDAAPVPGGASSGGKLTGSSGTFDGSGGTLNSSAAARYDNMTRCGGRVRAADVGPVAAAPKRVSTRRRVLGARGGKRVSA